MRERLRYFKTLLVRPLWLMFIILLTVVGRIKTLVGLLPADWQQRLSMLNLDISPTTWLILALVGTVVIVIEGSYRINRKKNDELETLRNQSAGALIKPLSIEIESHPFQARPEIGIRIENPNDRDASNVRVHMKEGSCFIVQPSGEKIPRLKGITGKRRFFCRDESIPARDEVSVNIAKATTDDFEWFFENPAPLDKPYREINENIERVKYELQLMIDGKIDDYILPRQNCTMWLVFTKTGGLYNMHTIPGTDNQVKQYRDTKFEIDGGIINCEQEPTET